MKSNLLSALSNLHISVPIAVVIVLELIPVWFPSVKQQCQETLKVLLAYGVIAAANSGPAVPK